MRPIARFTHADAGQLHVYLNNATEHWTHAGENPPVGLIVCAQKNEAIADYFLDNLPDKVLAREYRLTLPEEKVLTDQLRQTQRALAARHLAEAGADASSPARQNRCRLSQSNRRRWGKGRT